MSRTNHRATLVLALTLIVVAAACLLLAPTPAHGADFTPSPYDDFTFDRLYAAGSTAYPEALSLDMYGRIYYTWSNYNTADPTRRDRIYKIRSDGTTMWSAGSPYISGTPSASHLYWPCGLAVDAQRYTWVADTCLNRVKRLNTSGGTYLVAGGPNPGTGQLQFDHPKGIAVDGGGTVYVADTGNHRIQVLSSSGAYLREWGSFGSGTGQFIVPDGVSVDPDGNVWVADTGNNRIQKFSPTGTFLMGIGREDGAAGSDPGEFYGPADVAVDQWGAIYVADTYNGRIQRFSSDGTYLGEWSSLTSCSHEFLPTDIATDAFGNLFVSDPFNDRIQKWHFQMADADTNTPVTSSNIPPGWAQGTTFDVQLSSFDASLTVAYTYYSTDGTTPTVEYAEPFTVSTEGTTTVMYYSVDVAQNSEQVKTDHLRLDGTPPTTTCDASSVIEGTSAMVHLAATDSYSGVATTWYNVNGGLAQQYSGGIYLPAPGIYVIGYYSFDNVGNAEGLHYATVQLLGPDQQAPVTSSNIPAGWQNANVSVSLTATDESAISGTYYSVDGSPPSVPYTSQFVVSTEGTTTVKYFSVDIWGNVETERTEQVRVDNTAPITTSNVQSSYTTTATINLSASDPLSGVSNTMWRLDGGSWTVGAMVDVGAAPASHTLQWYSTDVAGNAEDVQTASFDTFARREETDPALAYAGTWTTVNNGGLSGGSFRTASATGCAAYLTFTGTKIDWITSRNTSYGKARVTLDAGAPVDIDLYGSFAFKQRVWTSGTLPDTTHTLRIDYTGTKNPSSSGYTIGVDAVDVIGTLQADATVPVTTSTIDDAWHRGSVTVTLTASDANSYVLGTFYRVGAGAVTTYTAPFSVAAEGANQVSFWSRDAAGNTEATKTATVRIDNSAPSTTDDAPDSWVTGVTHVELDATDELSGTGGTHFSLDGSVPSLPYTGPIAVSAEGTTTLKYRSTDSVGNIEEVRSALVRIDNTAPDTSDDAPAGWVTGPVSVTLTAHDSLSGVAATFRSLNGGAPGAYLAPIVISSEGTNTVTYGSTDTVGRTEATRTATVRIDNTAPSTTSNVQSSYTTTATIIFSATDLLSGVASTMWRLDGGSWNAGTSATVPQVGGPHTLQFKSTDTVGNVESAHSASFDVVKRVEQTDAAVLFKGTWGTVTNGGLSGGSFKTSATSGSSAFFTFTGTKIDWITSRNTSYGKASLVLDGGAPIEVDLYGSFSMRQVVWTSGTLPNATHTLRIDYTGTKNASSTGYTIGVDAFDLVGEPVPDAVAPVTQATAPSGWQASPSTVTLSASDAQSFVQQTYYRVGTGAVTTYTAPFSVTSDGDNAVTYWSVDGAGNVEATKTVSVKVDKVAPVTGDNSTAGWLTGPKTFGLTAEDAHSGVASTYYSTDGSQPTTPYTGSFTISAQGVTTVKYCSADVAGNSESVRTATVSIDGNAPVTSSDAPTGWVKGSATVHVSATDTVSGVSTTKYRLNGSAATTCTAPVQVTPQGANTLVYWSTDVAGNAEEQTTKTILVDGTAPQSSCDATASYIGTATVTIAATDAHSGVGSTKWRLDGSSWTTGTVATVPSGGIHVLDYYATDAVGNAETMKSASFEVQVRVEQTESLLSFDGTWNTITHPSLSGGSSRTTAASGTAVNFAFAGNRVDWIMSRNTNYGIARVIVDGGAPTLVDLYGSFSFKQKVWSSGTLSNGPHTVRIEYTGTKNAASAGYTIGVDAFDLVGTLTSRRYEQDDSLLNYEAAWNNVSHPSLSATTAKTTAIAGAAVNVAFSGTRLDWIGSRNTSYGKARVTVDNTASVVVDLYGTFSFKNVLWSSGTLSPGSHVVRIEYLGEKNASSTGYTISVDAFDVVGVLTQASAPVPPGTRYEQTSTMLAYEGTWTTVSSGGLSGGSFVTATSEGAAANVAFSGTKIDWVTSKNTSYGKAKVILDGGTPEYVDLYGTVAFKQKVWTSGTLADGTHTLRIEYGGLKNSSSSGYLVGVDAFDVIGTLTQAVPLTPPATRFEETSPLLSWEGTWTTTASTALSDGAFRTTIATGSAVNAKFQGTKITWITSRNTTYGIASVSVDGGAPVLVDLYAPMAFKQSVWTSPTLTDGVHTLRIAFTGTKNASSTGLLVGLDALDVQGSLLQAP